jgi:hypothetical protein
MKYFLDCEFNSFGGELISLALVSHDQEKRFYEVLPYDHMDLHPWVKGNVIPVLYRKPKSSKEKFTHKLGCFLRENAVNDEITIIADWPEDIKYFCESLIISPGRAVVMPNINFILDRVNLVSTADYFDSMVPHNALADALALARNYKEPV